MRAKYAALPAHPTHEGEQAGSDDRSADDFGADNFGNEPADWNTGGGAMRSTDDEDETYPEQAAEQASLRAHLHNQLTTSSMDGKDRNVVGLLIDALDENGYLAQDLDELVMLLPPELEITLDDLETALVQLQHLDQPGLALATWANAWPCNSKPCLKTSRTANWRSAW